MGIFSRVFGKKAEPSVQEAKAKTEAKKLRLEDADSIIISKTQNALSDFGQTTKEFKTKFVQDLSDLMDLFDHLEKTELQRLVLQDHRDVTDIIKTSRAHYVQSSRKLMGDAIIRIKTENDPVKIQETVSATFDKLNGFSKQAQIILSIFKSEMKEISLSLKKLYSDMEDFGNLMEKDYSKIRQREEMRQIVNELIKSRTSQRRANERIKILEGEIKSVSKNLENLVSQRDKIIKSQDYMHYERLKDETEEITKQKEQLLRDIKVQADGVEKIVNTYLHESTDINRAQAELLREMSTEPRQIVSRFQVFESALRIVGKGGPGNESLEGKDKKKKKKSKEYITILDTIRELVIDFEKFSKREEKIKKEIEKSQAAPKVKELSREIDEIETRQKNLTGEKEDCEGTISTKHLAEQQKLEIYLSGLIGEKIRVV